MKFAAIDQGTTSTRVLVTDETGAARIHHAARHAQHHPRPGWVEHDPRELLAHVRDCLTAAGRVEALGIAHQGESCLAWDSITGVPLSPVIVWQDNRTSEHIAHLAADGAGDEVAARAGLPLDPYFSATKLAWLIDNIPEAKAARRAGRLRLGTTDAFFLDRLTGSFATDISTASRTSLMNLETGCWDAALCDLFHVPIECLPEIRPTVGDFGLAGSSPLKASIVDQQAALFGHGCRRDGDVKITFGTGAFALALTGERIVRSAGDGLVPTVAWQWAGTRTYAVDGGVYDAGAAVEWAQRIGIVTDVAELNTFAALPAIDRGLTFVPALSGLACPHWDRSAASLFIGMTADTTRVDLCQALLEGIALQTCEMIEAIDRHVPLSDRLPIDGGLARSGYFAQFLADTLGRTIVVAGFDELTAFGTAALAARAIGKDLPRPKADHDRLFHPRQARRAERRARFAEAVSRSRCWRGAAIGPCRSLP
ncbi:FGGY family carbohydrate kinase [Phreatobacter stygius]|uniref:ATP:glycerol 3-phosphotransferase n=1 Tax=Phreatobacter stygius TaxID=1940610 RepID=A0A4D7B2S6_9HYPH|nr:FGGY family carbohydrate kinase [Phreatobacter stygius]QCI63836.1 glycerol kinase [Phreatobacter stygius]